MDANHAYILREKNPPLMMAANRWEKVTLLVDSGASDTCIPERVCSAAPIQHTAKVGIEYECANDAVLFNLGERCCSMKTAESGEDHGMTMAFQVVDVQRPLLSVSRVCSQGHDVVFSERKGDFIWINGDLESAVQLRKSGGVYELDVWLKPQNASVFPGREGSASESIASRKPK